MSRALGLASFAVVALLWNGCSSSSTGSTTQQEATDPSQLAAPPSGQGVQLETGLFTVPAGTEVQACYFFKVADLLKKGGMDATKPLELHRVEIVQRPGSHHMNLFRVRTITGLDPANGAVQVGTNGSGQCFVSTNWSDWPLVANTQTEGNQDWQYPDGVANEIDPTETLMLQTHYVNAATQQTAGAQGQVAIDLYAMDPAAVKYQLGTVFATDQGIRVCESNPRPTFGQGCQFRGNQAVTVVGANGHFHSRGTQFDIYTWDGKATTTPPESDRFYESTSWADPPMLHSPELAKSVGAGGGFWWTCSYQWEDPSTLTGGKDTCATLNAFDAAKHGTAPAQQDCCYTFGPQVDLNEHCNAFVYYYPRQDNVNCF
jgi:hypothetical protein